MSTVDVSLDAQLFNLYGRVVREGLGKLKVLDADDEGREWYLQRIRRQRDWYHVKYADDGLPHVSWTDEAPKDFTTAFAYPSPSIPLEEHPSFQALWDYVAEHREIRMRYFPERDAEEREEDAEFWRAHQRITVSRTIYELIDRYVHIYGTFEFSEVNLWPLFFPLLQALTLKDLTYDVCFPILGLVGDFDKLEINQAVSLERIEQGYYISSRLSAGPYPEVSRNVLMAATHWLVFREWSIENTDLWRSEFALAETRTHEQAITWADDFFACLRILTGCDTGYSQVLVRPRQWVSSYTANLPPLTGSTIHKYPKRFEDANWRKAAAPAINVKVATEAGTLYEKLRVATENSIHIAVRRLNRSSLRDDDDDSLLDATIGLETLLTDDEKSEMTYKLALRIAGLSRLVNDLEKTPYQVFREVKKVYQHRSAIVHGASRPDKTREVKLDDDTTIAAVALAFDYLRMVLRVLIENCDYRRPARIDSDLLLGLEHNASTGGEQDGDQGD